MNKYEHNYILPSPISSSFFYRASPVPSSGHLHFFLLFLTFYKEAVIKVLNIHRKKPMLESIFNKVLGRRPATLLKRDSNTGVLL